MEGVPNVKLLGEVVVMACCSGPQPLHPLLAVVVASTNADNRNCVIFMQLLNSQMHAF